MAHKSLPLRPFPKTEASVPAPIGAVGLLVGSSATQEPLQEDLAEAEAGMQVLRCAGG